VKKVFPRFQNSRKMNILRDANLKSISGGFSRILLAVLVVAAVSGMYFSSTVKRAGLFDYAVPDLEVGDISPKREIAIIDFQVPKSPEQLREERRHAAEAVIPVFNLERASLLTILAELDTLFSIVNSLPAGNVPDSVKAALEDELAGVLTFRQMDYFRRNLTHRRRSFADTVRRAVREGFSELYGNLIVSRRSDLRYYSEDLIMLEEGDSQWTVNIDEILDVASAGDSLGVMLHARLDGILPAKNVKAIHGIVKRFIRPNLSYNAQRTGELRAQAMEAVPLHSASYKKNERIIEANVPVSESQVAALKAYRKELQSQAFEENRRKHYAAALGKIVIALGLIGVFSGYLYLYRPRIFRSFSYLLLLALISALPLSVAYYSAWVGATIGFLVPVSVATILATILFDAEIGIMMSLGLSLLVATLMPGTGMRIAMMYFLGGSVGVLTVGRVRHRKEFYRSMFFIPVTMAVAVVSTNDWIANPSFADLGKDVFAASLNGFFCPIIAIGLLPILESVFKIATDITLLELSDLNNPLLREMAVKAPGTFSSVLMVGALAEAAAEKIGANALLARVGAYYHDIGKTVIPEYFIENQHGGENPHDKLSPHMSALVIASHVKEGYELGVKHGLPEAILDIIKQHHGTSLMASIYHKAQEQTKEGEEVDESAFRYPGPKPQTREAGIVMLADLVEAASRTVQERTPGRLKALIHTIIEKRFMEGELDECDLTLRDLHNIEESFLPVLVASYHGRIEYPWQREERDAQAAEQESGEDVPAGGAGKNGKPDVRAGDGG